jgi:nascent polypeptide-associated complex subunit beta
MDVDRLQRLANSVRTGGKGSVRRLVLQRDSSQKINIFHRKKKAVHKTVSNDDKKLHTTLKRIGMNDIPGIEEVNIFQSDHVINFVHPKGMFLSQPFS